MSVDDSVLSVAIDQDGDLVGVGQPRVICEANPLLVRKIG